ncbi:MAG: PAS domain-containing protein [Methylibium sp.]|nr:PAS domain-containing protein [Methylibium sp.]
MNAAVHPEEAHRVERLRELDAIDAPASDGMDALVACASRLTRAPIALITLIDETRQWVVARIGVDITGADRHDTFCSHAILGTDLMEVADLRTDPRFRENSFVVGGPRLRFYAGQPLTIEGLAVGTLCVMDVVPRRLGTDERETLQQLGCAAVELLMSRKRQREAVRERERLLDFGRAAGDWMWESDAEHRYRWLCGELEPLTGLTPQALLGSRIDDAVLLDDRGEARAGNARLLELLERRQSFSRVVTTMQTPRGPLQVSHSAVPVLDAAGRFAGYRGTARDVSAALTSAGAAHRNEALLRRLATQVPGVLFSFRAGADGHTEYPFVSEGAERVFGLPAAELQADANAFFRRVWPDDLPALRTAIADCAARGAPLEHAFRLTLKDGTQRCVETRAAPTAQSDGSVLWHGFTTDITERRATEAALREHEERWQLAAAAAGIGIAQFTLADMRIVLDAQACINHGLAHPQPQFLLADWVAQIDAADREAALAGVHGTLASGAPFEGRYRIHRPDGSMRWLEFVLRATFDAGKRPDGVIGTCRDVHEQQIATELQRAKQEAERASRAKTQFLSRVSHELRTPLNGMLGFAQLMALDRDQPLAGEQARRLASVQRAGQHLLGLVDDVLELSRIEHSEFTLQMQPVSLDAALASALKGVQPLAENGGVALDAPPPGGQWVQGDARAIEQVLMNLLSNAIRFSRRGASVTVRLEPAGPAGEPVAIHVVDSGAGISPAQQKRLFQPFERLERSGDERRLVGGSGLGLVIAHQLVTAMGGSISVQSASNAGSTFSVRLASSPAPIDDATANLAPPRPPAAAAPQRAQPRLLYIEDELLNQMLMQEVLRARPGWQLQLASDGASGLALARAGGFDLLLIDMNLPDTNGLALIRALRAAPQTAALRCIALSADVLAEQIAAARAAGFDDYWTKPIDVRRVLAGLDAALGLAATA